MYIFIPIVRYIGPDAPTISAILFVAHNTVCNDRRRSARSNKQPVFCGIGDTLNVRFWL